MLRGIWQKVKERIYDSVSSVFRTQEEIDVVIADELGEVGTVVSNPAELPAGGHYRSREFYFVDDLKLYLNNGGIPSNYVYIIEFPDWDEDGNTMYKLYITEN